MLKLERIPGLVVGLFLAVITVLTHLSVIKNGVALLNADIAIFPLIADDLRGGYWQAFLYQQHYGGIALTVVRAGWTVAWETLFQSPHSHLTAHMTFTYGFVPVLLTLSAYYFARGFCSKGAALLVGLIAAVGHHYIITTAFVHGNEFYSTYLILGLVLMGWRLRIDNPWKDLSPIQLVAAGILSGLSFYTHRGSLVFIVAFFTPWQWLTTTAKRVFSPHDRYERMTLWLAGLSFGLYWYLKIWGENIGVFFGRHVKLHSGANSKLTILLLGALILKTNWRHINKSFLIKVAFVVVGLLIGLAPELAHWINQNRFMPLDANAGAGTGGEYSLSDMFKILAHILINVGVMAKADEGFGRNASLLLLIFGIYAFIKAVRVKPRLRPLLIMIGLTFFSYLTVYTYLFAPSRYLLPAYILILAAYGLLYDSAKTKLLRFGVIALAIFHMGHHLNARERLLQISDESRKVEQMWKVVNTFKKENVSVVIAANFWNTNQFTLMSQRAPYFVSPERHYGPLQGYELVKSTTRIGMIFEREPEQSNYFDRNWIIEPLTKVGPWLLYTARATQ